MAYKTDGSSDLNGKRNEKDLVPKLLKEANNLFPFLGKNINVIAKGGTQYKQDLEVTDGTKTVMISAKLKKSLKTGSFDYVNSSKAVVDTKSLSGVKKSVLDIKDSETDKEVARTKLNEVFHSNLKKLTSSDVRNILKDHILEKNKSITIVVTDESSNKNYVYSFIDTPLADHIANSTPSLKFGRGKTSAKILFNDAEGAEHDIGLRLRLVLNNGVGALLGTSKTNSVSIPVIKIQQDKVQKMMDGIAKKVVF
jgi:hypothetical protein